jgi:hypothetical protein
MTEKRQLTQRKTGSQDDNRAAAPGWLVVLYSLLIGVALDGLPDRCRAAGESAVPNGARRALILCGHPGDAAHRTMYADTVEKLYAALLDHCRFARGTVWVRFGTEPQGGDGPAVSGSRGLSNREGIEADVAALREELRSEDKLWVIVLGHAHFDGRHAFLNLPGRDIRDDEFGELFEAVHTREQVFFVTTPVSGYFVKHLSAKGRIVITATEADLEVNETLFHLDLADVLSDPAKLEDDDMDQDGRISVLDLYLTVARHVLLRYAAEKNIPTEHAQLDDNGDGRGTEVQLDYLERELGGRAAPGYRPPIRATADGALAAQTTIGISPTPNVRFVPSLVPLLNPAPLPIITPRSKDRP